MSSRLEDAGSVSTDVGCEDTQHWVSVDRPRGLDALHRGLDGCGDCRAGDDLSGGSGGVDAAGDVCRPVRWDEMREQFFGLLREAIAASGGREFKNMGDGLMVAFASASAAVGCAVLTQQLFERRYRGAEQRLRVRATRPPQRHGPKRVTGL